MTTCLFEAVVAHGNSTVLFASSVAAFGGRLPEMLTDDTPQWPATLYGVTKMTAERLGAYYHERHGLDFRCLRLPITISRHAPPGAASALASHAFLEAVRHGRFTFAARPDTKLAAARMEPRPDGRRFPGDAAGRGGSDAMIDTGPQRPLRMHPNYARLAALQVARASDALADLANRSMDAVERDGRALVSTVHVYAIHVARAVAALDAACSLGGNPALQTIRDRFVEHMEAIIAGNGLSITRDTAAPAQGCFQVPNLGITIVPLVYGDHHSWNLAWLDGTRSDVPCHLHREGVEIHLGYGPLHGHTILGDAQAEVTEGYAMPIPPGTRHGYTNIGSRTHHVPFIFGSLVLGGWGVFLDVDARPTQPDDLAEVTVTAPELNGTVFLEREIARAAAATMRRPVIPAARTDRDGVGGIALSIARVAIGAHDHFGIPAGLAAVIESTPDPGAEPLVLLDAVLRPAESGVGP